MEDSKDKRVQPYPDPVREPEEMVTKTYEYHHPFNYTNVEVFRRYFSGGEFHGLEMNPVNSIAVEPQFQPPDTITITHEQPIVRVVVMGSTCQPPGYIQLEAEPLEEFYREDHYPGTTAARFRIGNLWGMHMRWDQWTSGEYNTDEPFEPITDIKGRPYPHYYGREKCLEGKPHLKTRQMKASYRENPLVGMSAAVFEIPKSCKVTITGGGEVYGWQDDNYPDDIHYSFRVIRTTVLV